MRWTMSAAATGVALAAFGATQLQPSAQRLAVAAITGLIAPLFWPGCGATGARTLLRIVAWSAGAAALAATALRLAGGAVQPPSAIAAICAMLLVVMLAAHAAAATLERLLVRFSAGADDAGEMAGRITALALAFFGALPVWLGPAAELLSGEHAWAIDTVIAASPLTHLAVASGNDLLRNAWFYRHANLAALQFSYPGFAGLSLSYAVVCLVLAVAPLASARAARAAARVPRPFPPRSAP